MAGGSVSGREKFVDEYAPYIGIYSCHIKVVGKCGN